jgi:hypothetical protein
MNRLKKALAERAVRHMRKILGHYRAALHRRISMVDQALHEHAASLLTAAHVNRSRRLIKCAKILYAGQRLVDEISSGQRYDTAERPPDNARTLQNRLLQYVW